MYKIFNFYTTLELYKKSFFPLKISLEVAKIYLNSKCSIFYDHNLQHLMLSSLLLIERIIKDYNKPEFEIQNISIEDQDYSITQKIILKKSFCNLIHFKKNKFKKSLPKLLIVAPMSGHYATLIEDTIKALIPYTDIYLTDWINASEVPVDNGRFDLDDFIDYLVEFINVLGPNIHTIAVCQPTVPLLVAISLLSQENNPNIPNSMTLIGGPIDARKNPTFLNKFVTNNHINWFKEVMITNVPPNYKGFGRKVYPGFFQLLGFMSLNPIRHINSHLELLEAFLEKKTDIVNRKIKFYDEYFAVMDITEEFFLQTIQEVFKEFELAKDIFISRDRKISLTSISDCALFGIEGELDDIASVGQTAIALSLCKNIPQKMKRYHVQSGAGHYGTFSGSKFKEFIAPKIKDFIYDFSFQKKQKIIKD